FGRGPGGCVHESAEALWFETPIPVPPYNMVARFNGGDDADAAIDAIFDHFRERAVPFIWLVHPTASPSDLRERLRRRGFDEVEVLMGMAMDLSSLPEPGPIPEGIEIR